MALSMPSSPISFLFMPFFSDSSSWGTNSVSVTPVASSASDNPSSSSCSTA
ncbi:MAG: hypothetical protein J6Y16_00435 [Treponema sp.]|nr:hypothetical protein [Treponema sp.]